MGMTEKVNDWSDGFWLVTLSLALFVVYISFGYLQESVIREPGFTFMEFMTLWQNFSYFFFGLAEYLVFGNGFREISRHLRKPDEALHIFILECKRYGIVGILCTGTIGLSNYSFRYISFPVQQLFKSCKLLPVMIARIVYLGETSYELTDYVACFSLMSGLALFTMADRVGEASMQLIGLVTILAALIFDGISGSYQEKVLHPSYVETWTDGGEEVKERTEFSTKNHLQRKLLIFAYGFATLITLGIVMMTDELRGFIAFQADHPDINYKLLLIGFNSYIGVRLVIELVQRFDSGVATTVTTLRKFTTVLLSYYFFPRPISLMHVVGGSMVLGGFWVFNSRIFRKT